MEQYRPKAILALGNVPLRHLTGEAGKGRSISHMRGYVFDTPSGLVVPSFHPAFIRRGAAHLIGVLTHDLKKAVQVAQKAFLNRVRGEQGRLLTYDIETPNSRDIPEDERDNDPSFEIISCQFSLSKQEGIFFPWKDGYREIAREILSLHNPKAGHNGFIFDNPRLRHNGAVINGEVHDTLWMFHHLQPDLPAHLQFVASFYGMDFPWKHLSGSDDEYYGCADVDAPQRIMASLPDDLKRRGVWDSYVNYIQRLHPVLEKAQDRGLPINNDARLQMKGELEIVKGEILGKLREAFPPAAKKLDPKEGYKGVPPKLKEFIASGAVPPFLHVETKTDEKGRIREYPFQYIQLPVETVDAGLNVVTIDRWFKRYEFNPSSWQQLILYMKTKKHPVPKNMKTDDETTAKKELERLVKKTGDKFYLDVIQYREADKMLGTYVHGFTPAADGRVHTTFAFGPATGQLASKSPNVQNIPKHSKLAKAFRKMIEAPSGSKLMEFDYTAFHALTTGFEAKDSAYMRAARLDIHSIVSGHITKLHDANKLLEKTDDEIKAYCSWYKSDPDRKFHRDKKAKPCIAEGELVLTDKGLVPIQNVTLDHRVWDGIEWVNHAGVIFQGVKEVITYDGLTATPEHEVILQEGRSTSLRQAALEMARIEVTGDAGQAVQSLHCDFLEHSARERIAQRQAEDYALLSMCLREEAVGPQGIPRTWNNQWLSILRDAKIHSSASLRAAIRCHHRALQSFMESCISSLWWSWDRMPLSFTGGVCAMDSGQSTSQGLLRSGDRSDKQRWPLRTGEPSIGCATGTDTKYSAECVDDIPRATNKSVGLSFGLSLRMAADINSQRSDRRTDNPRGRQISPTWPEGMGRSSASPRRARVYDITDAGPRKCYTVSNKLVLNCILGIGFGLGERKLYDMNQESFSSSKEAKAVRDTIKGLFPKVFQWQDSIREQAHNQTFLLSRFGCIRWFWDVFHWDSKSRKMVPGDDSEAAIAFLPANDAFCVIKDAMLQMEELKYNERYQFVNQIHDALKFIVPNPFTEECGHNVRGIMEQPSSKLVDPVVAPDGLACGVGVSIGQNWSEMVELK